MTDDQPLRLIALEPADLEVISTNAQDSILRPTDMAWSPRLGRFTLILNRFNWTGANKGAKARAGKPYERRRAALNFDRVTQVQRMNISQENEGPLEFLAILFEQDKSPGGVISLVFAGGGTIRLTVECVEAQLEDLGAAWATRMRPNHGEEDHGEEDRQ